MEELRNSEGFSGNLPSKITLFDSSTDGTKTDDRNMTEKVDGEITLSADLGLPSPVPATDEDDGDWSTEGNAKEEKVDNRNPLSPELQQGFRILKELMADGNKSVNWHFLEAVDSSHPETANYYERIKRPVWLGKMFNKFEDREYETITEFVSDFRLMLENCYRYNGPDHYVSKRGQKLETMMEQKLALLSRELREKTSIAATSGQNSDDISFSGLRRRTRTIIPHDSSALLSQLREEELRRDREQRKQQITDRKAVQEAQLQEILDWETAIFDSKGDYMRAMWELPQIGHFLFLCQDALNIGEIPQFELERCFYMPRESVVMQKVMTALLSTPFQRMKIDKKTLMPYSIWDEKLRLKLRQWYKIFVDSHEDIQKTAVKLGIDGHFFDIVGKRNPLERRKFHDLCPYRRVWIVKSLCDYCLEHQESIRDAIESQPIEEQHDYLLGVDADGTRYLHFPQFCGADLRIYKQEKIHEPKLPVLETPKQKEKEPEQMVIDIETSKAQNSKKKKKKRKKLKPELPAPPTNRPSRLRQKIKTVIPVRNYSSSSPSSSDDEEDGCDESDGSDANTRTSFGDQSDLNLNDSGICDGTPRKRDNDPLNKPLQRLMESDNCSDTSSVDGESACKRSRHRRLVRNGLLREFNVSEQSLDESSMDRDEISEAKDDTLSETSNTLDSLEDSNGACKNIKTDGKHIQDRNETEMCESDTDSQMLHPVIVKKGNDISGYEPMDEDAFEEMDAKGDNPKDIKTTDVKQSLYCNTLSAPDTESPSDGIGSSPKDPLVIRAKQSSKSDSIQESLELSECNTTFDVKPESNTPTSNPPKTVTSVKHEVDGVKTGSPLPSEKNRTTSDRDSSETSTSSCDKYDTSNIKVKVEMTENDPEQGLGQIHDHDYSGQSQVGKFLDHDYGQSRHADLDRVKGEEMDCTEVKTEVKKEEEEEIEKLEEVFPEVGPFKLIVECVEDLKQLVETFAEQEPIVIGKGKKQKVIKPPPRKRCVVDLHGRLLFLLKELEPWEQKLIQATRKARLKMHKEQTTYFEEEVEEKWESEHSDSSGSEECENSDSDGSENEDKNEDEESNVVSQQMTTTAAALTNNIFTPQNEITEDCDDIDVSSRGRIRKRRVIPNNSEDPGTPKKRKLVNVSLPTSVPHVPNILQRPGKTLPPCGPVDGSSASQILLQTSSGNHTLLTGLPSNVKLVSGDKMFQPQALSLLQRPAQIQQHSQVMSHARLLQGLSQHTLSSKQASHPVIQQLLSTSRHPSPRVSLPGPSHTGAPSSTLQRTVLFPSGNKQTNIRPAITKLTTPGLSMVSGAVDAQLPGTASTGGKIQYYAANINTLPPSVLQQLIKSNALKIPPGPNQSGMVLLTTVNPQAPTCSSQSQTIAGLQTTQNTPVRTQQTGLTQPTVPKTILPVSTQVSSAASATPEAMVKKSIAQINTAVNIHMNVPSTNSSIGHLQNVVNAPSGGIVMSTSQIESTLTLKEESSTNFEGSVGNAGVVSCVVTPTVCKPQVTSNCSSLSPTNISSTSPNRQPYKYANNVTVKTLLEARKDAEKIPGESTKPILVKKTSEITSSTPTVLLHPTSTGIKTLKIPSKAALDSAVQAVVTDVPTSLPTVNIKVPAPSAMPAIQPRYNVTKTIQSMKSPIPTAPRLDPMALSANTSVNVTSPSPNQTNQSLLTQIKAGNNQIMLTTLNKSSELGNMVLAAAQQPQDKKNMTVKVLPPSVQQTQQGVMQGYLTPQGLIIPQAALQQQANTQLLNQGTLNNQTITQSILKTQTLTPGTVNKQTITPGIIANQNLSSGNFNLQTISHGKVSSQNLSSMPAQIGFKEGSAPPLVSGNQLIGISQSNSIIKQNMRKSVQNSGKVVQPASSVQTNYGSSPSNLIQNIAGTQEKALIAAGVQSQAGNLLTALVRSGGSDAFGIKSVSSIINTTPVLSTSVISSASVKPSVSTDKSSSSVVDTQKVRLQAVGGGASTLLDLGGITKLQAQGQGLLMPGLIQGMNFVNVGGQLKLQDGSNNVTILGNSSINLSNMVSSTVSTCVSNPPLVSSNNKLGHIYPIVTLAGSTGSSGGQASQMVPPSPGPVPQASQMVPPSPGPVPQASQMVPPSPGPVPQSPLQLTSPLLGQLASPIGNLTTVLGQIANPHNKTAVIGQTALAGNLQLLGQPGVKVAGNSGQILRLPNQQMNNPSTSPSVIGQQLCLSGSNSQIIGQQLTSPIANQAPVVLGNIGQGSSSDLIKQLAAAQLQLSGQSSSTLVSPIPNQMVLQVPASPGVKGQAMNRPPGQQNLQGGQTMLLLSPQKRLQGASIGTGTQQPKQLTLRLNSPVLQQTQIKVPIVSSAKVMQDQNVAQLSKVKLNFDLQAANLKPGQANVSKAVLQTPVMGSVVPVSTSQATEILPTNPLHQKLDVKNNTTTIGTAQQANIVRFNTAASQVRLQTPSQQSVVVSLSDTSVSPSTGPLLSPAKVTTSQSGGSQKLFLYNIGGQLVTPQGVPVTVDNGVLKVLLPQSKTVSPPLSLGQKGAPPVTIVSGANLVRYVVPTKPVYGTQSSIASESLTASVSRSNAVVNITSSPGSILTNQSTKVNPSVGKVLPSVSAINMSPSVVGVSTRSIKGVMSPSLVTASVASLHSVTNTPQSVRTATVNVTSSVLSQPLGSTSHTLPGNELPHIVSPAVTTGKTVPTTDNVGLMNHNQMTASSNLKMSQLLGQQQSNMQDITVRFTGHSSVASASNNKMAVATNLKTFHVQNDTRTQIGYQVSPNISSLIGSGQGYIVMPGTSKKTQIIFPQQGQQNSSSNTENVKVLKTQNIAELMKSKTTPATALVQQGAVSVSLHDMKAVQAENPIQNNTPMEPKSDVLNNNVALYRSQNVVDLGTNVSETKVTTMDNNHKPVTVTNGVEDNQNTLNLEDNQNLVNQVPPKPSQDNSSTETSESTETPKGAEKEEAALNLLSLANLAFNR